MKMSRLTTLASGIGYSVGFEAKRGAVLFAIASFVAGATVFAWPVAVSLTTTAAQQTPNTPPALDHFGDPLPAGAIQRLGTVRFRPGGEVHALAISPDGKWIVSAGVGGIRFWDSVTGRPGDTLRGHKSHVFSVQFSADGKRLVSAGAEDVGAGPGTGKLIIWDLSTRRPLVTIEHPGWVQCCTQLFRPDCQFAFPRHGMRRWFSATA